MSLLSPKVMYRKPPNHNKQVAGVAVAAATLGVVSGALLAPKSGRETRHDIAEGTRAAKHKATNRVKSMRSRMLRKAKPAVDQAEANLDKAVAKAKTSAPARAARRAADKAEERAE